MRSHKDRKILGSQRLDKLKNDRGVYFPILKSIYTGVNETFVRHLETKASDQACAKNTKTKFCLVASATGLALDVMLCIYQC